MVAQDVTQRTSRRVYEVLRQWIITGALRPGEVINEAAIMEKLKVGRTPLREATLLLIEEGLVRTFPRRGTFVSDITVDSLQHALEMRPRLEAIALEICCDKANDNELQHLANLVNDYEVVSSVDSHEFDFNVHSLIVRLAHNDYLYDAWIRVYTACSRLKYSSLSPIQDAQTMLTELREVVCHLQHRDVHAAKEAMEVHLRSFILGLGPIAASKEWLSGMK